MERRNTIQREIVMRTVNKLHTHATADDIYNEIAKEYPSIGKGTVYRNLNILAEEEKIRKVEVLGEAERFDFTTRDHYHVKCIVCKNIFDVDMDPEPDLLKKIKDNHGIDFLNYEIQFSGICRGCKDKLKETESEITKEEE